MALARFCARTRARFSRGPTPIRFSFRTLSLNAAGDSIEMMSESFR
jgi:hypothetical protein